MGAWIDRLAHIPARMQPLARRFGREPIRVEAFRTAEAGIFSRETGTSAPHLEPMVWSTRALGADLRHEDRRAAVE